MWDYYINIAKTSTTELVIVYNQYNHIIKHFFLANYCNTSKEKHLLLL